MRTRDRSPGPIVRGQKVDEVKITRAREMRAKPTIEEDLLWQRVRRNALGYHFRRQQVIAGFIVDFYCHAAKLVVEVDGPIHQTNRDYDANRDAILTAMSLRGLRITAADVRERIDATLTLIADSCANVRT